jgi:alkanesulfonate monooxygenase SsuD/methylene tetrahydromethanopterin reductase-like flavin-dependent oxidoreductase (luciferase family)
VRIGLADVFSGENGRDAGLFLKMITSIESMGFVSYWASEHMFQFPADELGSQHPDGPRSPAAVERRGMYDCLTLLTAAIARTDTLRVGTEISLLPCENPSKRPASWQPSTI